jgi:hypothetical protein
MEVMGYLLQIFFIMAYYQKKFTKFEESVWFCFRDMEQDCVEITSIPYLLKIGNMKIIFFFSIFVGHFCPPGSGSGSSDSNYCGSGSTTLRGALTKAMT